MTTAFLRAAALISIVGAAPAAASTVNLTYNGLVNTPAETVKITAPLSGVTVYAGAFDMSGPDGDFIAWCIDLFQHIKSAPYEEARPGQVTDAGEADLNRLFTLAYDVALDNAVNAAAFQLSIWEIVYDTGSYDFGAGTFSVTNAAADVLSTASGWLSGLAGVTGSYDLTFFTSATSQDLVTGVPSPVPVPAGVLLLGSGLGALAVARRRRKTA